MGNFSIVKELAEIKKIWKGQDFKFTPEQQARYDILLDARRSQVAKFQGYSSKE